DQPVGSATKQEAWDKGLIHRIVRLMVENDKGELLLQHRSPTKNIYPDTWDPSAAGHVDAGEDYEEAMRRELQEELGLDMSFVEIGRYRINRTWHGHRFNRFVRCYRARVKGKPALKLEADKIDSVRWFTAIEAKKMATEHPEQLSDGL